MSLESPPKFVTCRSGDRLPGEAAYDGARRTFEYYSMSTGCMENLARLAMIFDRGFNPEHMVKLLAENTQRELESNKFVLGSTIKLSQGALTHRGIVAANMVNATVEGGDFDIELREPFKSLVVLPDLFEEGKNAPRSKEIFGISYS